MRSVLEWPLRDLPRFALEAAGLFLAATVVFDLIHYALHRCLESRWAPLRRLGGLHQAHHDFFDDTLAFHDDRIGTNLLYHVVPEYATQVLVTAAALLVLRPEPVLLALGFETLVFVAVLAMRGKDRNHVPFEVLPEARGAALGLLVTPAYHALHHVHPDRFYSSWTTVVDRVLGTACPLRGRRVVMTGASGAFGAPLRALLERSGAAEVRALKFGVDWDYDDYGRADDALAGADILVLCHGSKGPDAQAANCDSFVNWIERFRALSGERRFPVEVWAVGSEIEAHPAFGDPVLARYRRSKRAFARHARRYYRDGTFVYRHIVPSAFRSPMGPGLISGALAARAALALIRRGFRYVPVTYTGIALLNFAEFRLGGRASAAEARGLARQSVFE